MKKAVFLDRDGVINENREPVNKREDLILYPWVTESIKKIQKAGYMVFVVTNQGGIELGYLTEEDLQDIHDFMETTLAADDIIIDEIAYCPHYHTKCENRKPKPGMINKLATKYDIDKARSWMVGDRDTDVEAGKTAGCKTIKIGDKYAEADYNCANLGQAVDIILENEVDQKC